MKTYLIDLTVWNPAGLTRLTKEIAATSSEAARDFIMKHLPPHMTDHPDLYIRFHSVKEVTDVSFEIIDLPPRPVLPTTQALLT